MSKKDYTAREGALRGGETDTAERIVYWFEILWKLRQAAGAGVEPAEIIEQIMHIDPDVLYADNIDALRFLGERFETAFNELKRDRERSERASAPRKDITKEQVQAARAALLKQGIKPTQEEIAADLRVDVRTLRDRLKEWGTTD